MVLSTMLRPFFMSESTKVRVVAYSGAAGILAILLVKLGLALLWTDLFAAYVDSLALGKSAESINYCREYLILLGVVYIFVWLALSRIKKRFAAHWWGALMEPYHKQVKENHQYLTDVPEDVNIGQCAVDATKNAAEKFLDLYESMAYALLVTIGFFPKLWHVSAVFDFWPGTLLVLVVAICLFDSALSWLIARKLPELKQVNANDTAKYRDEFARSKNHDFNPLFERMQEGYRVTHWHQFLLDIWKQPIVQGWEVLPWVLLGIYIPLGHVTIGDVTKAIGYITPVVWGLSIFSNNFGSSVSDLLADCGRFKALDGVLAKAAAQRKADEAKASWREQQRQARQMRLVRRLGRPV